MQDEIDIIPEYKTPVGIKARLYASTEGEYIILNLETTMWETKIPIPKEHRDQVIEALKNYN